MMSSLKIQSNETIEAAAQYGESISKMSLFASFKRRSEESKDAEIKRKQTNAKLFLSNVLSMSFYKEEDGSFLGKLKNGYEAIRLAKKLEYYLQVAGIEVPHYFQNFFLKAFFARLESINVASLKELEDQAHIFENCGESVTYYWENLRDTITYTEFCNAVQKSWELGLADNGNDFLSNEIVPSLMHLIPFCSANTDFENVSTMTEYLEDKDTPTSPRIQFARFRTDMAIDNTENTPTGEIDREELSNLRQHISPTSEELIASTEDYDRDEMRSLLDRDRIIRDKRTFDMQANAYERSQEVHNRVTDLDISLSVSEIGIDGNEHPSPDLLADAVKARVNCVVSTTIDKFNNEAKKLTALLTDYMNTSDPVEAEKFIIEAGKLLDRDALEFLRSRRESAQKKFGAILFTPDMLNQQEDRAVTELMFGNVQPVNEDEKTLTDKIYYDQKA